MLGSVDEEISRSLRRRPTEEQNGMAVACLEFDPTCFGKK